jgi:DNA-binding beta-propeller fold protein YncE
MKTAYLLAFALAAGCTASAEEVQPPEDELFFPTGLAVTPGEAMMFVTNANSDLRYDSGSITVFDLAKIDQIVGPWVANQTTGGCTRDADRTETLDCEDQTMFVAAHAGVRIGNFATDIAVQDTGGGTLRLVVPTRGDPSVTWVDWNGTNLTCSSTAGFSLCDDKHRLTYVHNDPNLAVLPDEPFNAFADDKGQFAMVTHLTTGDVTLIDSPIGGDATIADIASNVFLTDPNTGLRGSTGVAGRTPGSDGDVVYVGSRSDPRVMTFTVGTPINDADRYLIQGNAFNLSFVGVNAGSSSDTRGMAFSASGDRLYLINRDPPSLQVYDTSLGPTGFPKNVGIGATDVCRQASTLTVLDVGDGDRAYVSCFQDGDLYVIDPRGLSSVEDVISVGRGPYAVAAAASKKKVYVTNFLEGTIAVIDVDPTSPFHNRVVLRIGTQAGTR